MANAQPTPPPESTTPAHPMTPTFAGPPSKHQLALMIWVAVVPTLTVLNVSIGPWLSDAGPVLRTFVLATIAVPIVVYAIMPRLHRVRLGLLSRRGRPTPADR